MGCFLTKDSAGENVASMEKLVSLKERLLPNSRAITVELRSCRDLKRIPAQLFRANGPYIEFYVKPDQKIAGVQRYRSSHRPCNGNPHWNPPEKFQFLIDDCEEAKIILVAFNFNSTTKPEEIGIGVLTVQDVNEKRAEKKAKLYSQETGEFVGEVDLLISSMKAKKAANIKEDSIYQYQRWQPGIGWGSTFPGHFLPTDPNVGDNSYGWSSNSSGADKKFGNFDEIAPPVPSNWEILIPWSAPGNADDADGWTYATDFNYLDWWPKQGRRMFVRRRLWIRQIVEREEAVETTEVVEDINQTPKIPVGFQVQVR